MSFSTEKVGGAKENLIVTIPSTDDPGGSAGPTVDSQLTGITGTDTGNILYWIEVDCRDNPIENGTFRLWKGTSAITVGSGSFPAHVWVPGIRGRIIPYHFPQGIRWGTTQHVYAAYVKGKGGTSGSSAPSGIVKVKLGIKIGIDS